MRPAGRAERDQPAPLEQTDLRIGRIIDILDEYAILDNTLVILIAGDNGASGEATLQRTLNEMTSLNGLPDLETVDLLQASTPSSARPAPTTTTPPPGPTR